MTANPSSENQSASASTQDVRGSGLSVASGSPLPTPHKSLTKYLRENLSKGIIDFSIRAEIHPRSQDVHFYIHPSAVSGDTEDFMATEDPFNWDYDMIFNLAGMPSDEQIEANARLLVAQLRANREANASHEP